MAAAPTFDLQSHSLCSDGELTPAEVVARAREAGIELLALTDHDTVAGVDDALAAAAALGGIRVVPAAELSALDGEHEDLHILGYRLNHHDVGLLEALARWRADRHARGHRMVDALRAEGWALDVPESDPTGPPIGRPHIARAVLAHPQNAERLADEGLADHAQVLEAYLIPGAPCYARRTTPTVAEAIAAIHAAGGLAVWAHPYWDLASDADVLDTLARFTALGLDGVEAFYATHTCEQVRTVASAALDLALLTTGSADFHGPDHPRFARFRAFDLCGLPADLGPIGQA